MVIYEDFIDDDDDFDDVDGDAILYGATRGHILFMMTLIANHQWQLEIENGNLPCDSIVFVVKEEHCPLKISTASKQR